MKHNKIKILGIFGNVANAGQERANCDVYAYLNQNYDLKVLVNKRGFHWYLQPFFDKHGIKYEKITFPWAIYKKSSFRDILGWMIDVVKNNLQFIYHYVKFHPQYIHIGNEYMFKTLMIPLLFVSAKINFRLGDRPHTKYFHDKLAWKLISMKVNRFVCDTHFIHGLLLKAGRSSVADDVVLYHPAPYRIKSNNKSEYLSNGRIRFGYIGQINSNKGVEILFKAAIEICKKDENVEFLFAGKIKENNFFNSRIKPILDSLTIECQERIKFLGHIEDVDDFYSSLNVHIAPTIAEEPYGLVLVEAKKNHKPSVIFKSGGMVELITHLEDGYICNEKSSDSLILAIKYYLDNPECSFVQGEAAYCSLRKLCISQENFNKVWSETYS